MAACSRCLFHLVTSSNDLGISRGSDARVFWWIVTARLTLDGQGLDARKYETWSMAIFDDLGLGYVTDSMRVESRGAGQ